MTIDEAINHAMEVASGYERNCELLVEGEAKEQNYKCSEEHRQLAEWLKELKQLREQTRWISVSERLPEDREIILFSTKTKCVFFGRYFDDNTDRRWYSFMEELFVCNKVVTAWMPLPEPYKAESEV